MKRVLNEIVGSYDPFDAQIKHMRIKPTYFKHFLSILQKQQYLAKHPEYRPDGTSVGLDDDISIISPQNTMNNYKIGNTLENKEFTSRDAIKKEQGKSFQGQKKRGWPRKNG